MMDALLLAGFGSGIQAAADAVANDPVRTVGGFGIIAWTVIRIVVAKFGPSLAPWLISLLTKIPGIPPVILPVIETTLAEVLKQLFDHLLKQGVPPAEAATIVQGVAKQSAPAVLAAMQKQFEAEVLASTKGD